MDPSVLSPHSTGATDIHQLYVYFEYAAAFILALVVVLAIYFSYRYSSKRQKGIPKQLMGNNKVELFMVGIPTLLVVVFFIMTINTMKRVLPPEGNHKPDIELLVISGGGKPTIPTPK